MWCTYGVWIGSDVSVMCFAILQLSEMSYTTSFNVCGQHWLRLRFFIQSFSCCLFFVRFFPFGYFPNSAVDQPSPHLLSGLTHNEYGIWYVAFLFKYTYHTPLWFLILSSTREKSFIWHICLAKFKTCFFFVLHRQSKRDHAHNCGKLVGEFWCGNSIGNFQCERVIYYVHRFFSTAFCLPAFIFHFLNFNNLVYS